RNTYPLHTTARHHAPTFLSSLDLHPTHVLPFFISTILPPPRPTLFPYTTLFRSDYTLANGTLTFAPGVTTQNISITVVSDTLDEDDETIQLTLSSPTNATMGAIATHTYTILDDDPLPSLSINNVTVTEGNTGTTNANFIMTLSPARSRTVTVNYATADGTATA